MTHASVWPKVVLQIAGWKRTLLKVLTPLIGRAAKDSIPNSIEGSMPKSLVNLPVNFSAYPGPELVKKSVELFGHLF